MAKYIIGSNVENIIASTGTPYKKFNVKAEDGTVTKEVVAFSFFSEYPKIMVGAEIEGVLQEKDYKGKKSYSLVNGNLGAKPAGFGGGAGAIKAKGEMITKAQDRKEAGVEHSQERKERGIMISSTASMATQILVSLNEKQTIENWQKKWLEIRYWLVENWGNTSQPKVGNTGVEYPQDEINPEDIPF